MADQLRAYIADLQAKNAGVNVGALASAANPTTTIDSLLDALDQRLDNAVDTLGNNFGGGKLNANLTVSFDCQERLKGWGGTASTRYRSGAYTGAYEIREGGGAAGRLVETVPLFGQSTIDYDLSIRYRTRLPWLKNTRATFQLNVMNLPPPRRRRPAPLQPTAGCPRGRLRPRPPRRRHRTPTPVRIAPQPRPRAGPVRSREAPRLHQRRRQLRALDFGRGLRRSRHCLADCGFAPACPPHFTRKSPDHALI